MCVNLKFRSCKKLQVGVPYWYVLRFTIRWQGMKGLRHIDCNNICMSNKWPLMEFYVFRAVGCNIFIPYKPIKRTFCKVIFQFMMSSTCFQPEHSSSGWRFCIHVCLTCFGISCMGPHSLFDFHVPCVYWDRTRLLILMHVKHNIPYLYIQPSSWRWTLGFETCRRHHKLSY